jgi:NADH pyrophosphatase NudC (nudix superfamily)
MKQQSKIRVKVFGLIRDKERLFVSEDYDTVKQEKYYRALGGSIEFVETSHAALQREFQEEIQAELTKIIKAAEN